VNNYEGKKMTSSQVPADYRNRVYAGWLGKCIGVRFGAPVEGWTYKQIKNNLGKLMTYLPLPPGKIFKPDDDTAFPMILIRALQDFGLDVTAAQIGETWLNYLGDQHGTLWWGGYGISTEHTVYVNLASNNSAPSSGSKDLNGLDMAEQIGGQIFSDIWGLITPNNPELAADYATRASSVSHDGEGLYGGKFVAGLVSAAFGESDPEKLIEVGLSLIPSDSEYYRVVKSVLDFHKENPADWHDAYRFIYENWGYNRYSGEAHIIPNTAIIVMGLLYGQGDFSRTIQITNMGGWDTDCNVGNVGAIMGVAVGLEGIPTEWRDPMADHFVTASIIGSRNLLDIPACADIFTDLGQQIAGGKPEPSMPRYHFNYPGSTHGFQHLSGDRGRIISLQQTAYSKGNGLKVVVKKLNKKSEVRLLVRTAYRPAELSANYYGASFSSKISPGQHLTARLYLPPDAPTQLWAGLYIGDDNNPENGSHRNEGILLVPGEWNDLSYQIPPIENAYITQAGIVLRNVGEPWTGHVILDNMDWNGGPNFSSDFSRERAEYGAISQWTYLRGHWRLENGAYHGSGADINESYTGDIDWRDYSFSVRLIPLVGDYHNILARVQGARRSYAVGLAPDNKIVLYKNSGGYKPVASAQLNWVHKQSYTIKVAVQGNQLQVFIDGQKMLAWQDEDAPYLNGQIGFSNFTGCHTSYEYFEIN